VALTAMLDYKPDLVVSGINNGPNMGDDTLYSGTVAAATEGFCSASGHRLFAGRLRLGAYRRCRPPCARPDPALLRNAAAPLPVEREYTESSL
jgi:hypothetical protein